MTPSERDTLEHWDREHVWHPFTPMSEYATERALVVARAEGPYLFDLDGTRYIDGTSSLWCNVHGHRVPELDEALRAQLDQVAHCTLLGQGNVPSIRLARRLAEVAPAGLTRVFYSDSGATAVEVALKMAFQYWRQCDSPRPAKSKFLALGGAYHGDTLGDVSVGDIGRFHALFAPLLFPVERAPQPYCRRCPLGLRRETCELACLVELERLVEREADTLAAVVVEPVVQGAAGMVVQPAGYLRRVREVTRAHNVLLIADEVAVGFGRTGRLFACEHEGVAPDFLCVAKGLSGGYLPVAATLTTDAVYSAFLGPASAGRTLFHGHTFTGNPLGCAVALASLEKLTRGGVLDALPERIALMAQWLDKIRGLPRVAEVRHVGLLAGIELDADPAERVGAAVCRRLRARCVLLRPLRDTLVVMPPLTIPLDVLETLMRAVCDEVGAL